MTSIRPYQTGDASEIYTLFSEHTPYTRDDKFWVWINRMLANKPSIVIVAEKNKQIIGHYAIIPQTCIVQGKEIPCGLGIHAFIHPDYRQEISIFSITASAYKKAYEAGMYFIYGFPNANYRLIQEKIERWKKVALFKAFEKETSLISGKLKFTWREVNKNNYSDIFAISEILDTHKNSFIRIDMNLPFFINRYINHPQNLYKTWFIEHDNKKIGVAVTKIFDDKTEKKAHLIDFILTDNFLEERLLKDFEIKFSKSVQKISLWHRNIRFSEILKKNKYTPTGFETFFGIKKLRDFDFIDEEILYDIKKWDLPMGVSDAF